MSWIDSRFIERKGIEFEDLKDETIRDIFLSFTITVPRLVDNVDISSIFVQGNPSKIILTQTHIGSPITWSGQGVVVNGVNVSVYWSEGFVDGSQSSENNITSLVELYNTKDEPITDANGNRIWGKCVREGSNISVLLYLDKELTQKFTGSISDLSFGQGEQGKAKFYLPYRERIHNLRDYIFRFGNRVGIVNLAGVGKGNSKLDEFQLISGIYNKPNVSFDQNQIFYSAFTLYSNQDKKDVDISEGSLIVSDSKVFIWNGTSYSNPTTDFNDYLFGLYFVKSQNYEPILIQLDIVQTNSAILPDIAVRTEEQLIHSGEDYQLIAFVLISRVNGNYNITSIFPVQYLALRYGNQSKLIYYDSINNQAQSVFGVLVKKELEETFITDYYFNNTGLIREVEKYNPEYNLYQDTFIPSIVFERNISGNNSFVELYKLPIGEVKEAKGVASGLPFSFYGLFQNQILKSALYLLPNLVHLVYFPSSSGLNLSDNGVNINSNQNITVSAGGNLVLTSNNNSVNLTLQQIYNILRNAIAEIKETDYYFIDGSSIHVSGNQLVIGGGYQAYTDFQLILSNRHRYVALFSNGYKYKVEFCVYDNSIPAIVLTINDRDMSSRPLQNGSWFYLVIFGVGGEVI